MLYKNVDTKVIQVLNIYTMKNFFWFVHCCNLLNFFIGCKKEIIIVFKVRGFSLNYKSSFILNFESMKEVLVGWKRNEKKRTGHN